ncbi:MAG: 3'(2'),5'-bisphosphate nucleotidase CysQ, partial [Deltaproteobacteria bacterium]|nr:3'(2'),5'-bisphosphate nucleotidase CysQ [Deltaproteobacteria bacterium]
MNQLTYHLLMALLAAKDAGRAILDVYRQDFDISYKDDHSPLTLADQRSHNIIVSHLSDVSGERLPILSEEGRSISYQQRRRWKYFWMADPLDGTKEFVKKNDEFTVNIAQIHQNRPILGVIYVPVKDVFYFAGDGLGAYRMDNSDILAIGNNRPVKNDSARVLETILARSIKLPDDNHRFEKKDSQITIVGSRSHATKELEAFIETMRKNHEQVEFISAGSSLKLCLVAEGRADIYPRLGPTMEWDTAAGQVIVEQARGSVLNYEKDEPLRYNKKNLLNPWFVARIDDP